MRCVHHQPLRSRALGDADDVLRLRVVGREIADLSSDGRPAAAGHPRRRRHLAALVHEHVHAAAPGMRFSHGRVSPETTRSCPRRRTGSPNAGVTDRARPGTPRRRPSRSSTWPSSIIGHPHLGGCRPACAREDVDVPAQPVEQLVHLAPGAGGAVDFERGVLSDDPARDQQVTEVDRVVGVVMRDEDRRPIVRADAGLHELPADARARVHQEPLGVADDDERGRPAALGLGGGEPGAEQERAHGGDTTSRPWRGKVAGWCARAGGWSWQ